DRLDLAFEDPGEGATDQTFEATFKALREAHDGPPPTDGARSTTDRTTKRTPVDVSGIESIVRRCGTRTSATFRVLTCALPMSVAPDLRGASPGKWRNGRRARFRSVC